MIKKRSARTLVLAMGLVIFLSMSFVMPVEASSKWTFVEKIIKKDKKQISRIAKDVNLHKLPDAKVLSKKINLPENMLASSAVRKLVIAGEEVATHSPFASKMLNESAVPELVIKQYTRYGKIAYLKTAEFSSKTMTTNKTGLYKALGTLKGKYKGMNNVINKFNAGGYDSDIMVRTIRKTGQRGMDVLGWSAKHPMSASAGAVTAWYLYDPEGFEDALAASGQKVGSFASALIINVAAGAGEGIATGLKKSLARHSMSSVLGGALMIGIILLTVFTKTFRRLLLFPFTMFGKKINIKMDEIEEGVPVHKTEGRAVQKVSQQQTHKPRSNL